MALAVVVLTPRSELFANSELAKTVVLLWSVARTALAPSVKFEVSELPRERLRPESRNPPHAPTASSSDLERMLLIESFVSVTFPDDDTTCRLSPLAESFPDT